MAKKCAVSVCDGQGSSKGCCPKHYQRFLKLKLLDGLETVTPAQADDFDRRWEAAREANPRMASGSKGGGSGKTHTAPLPKLAPTPTAQPEPVRDVVPTIKAAHKPKAPVPDKTPPKPLPAPVYPDVRAMDDALLETVKRERDALSAKAMRLSREVEQLKRDMGSVEGALEAVSQDRDDLRAKLAARDAEIEKLRAKSAADDDALNNTAARLKAKAEEVDRAFRNAESIQADLGATRRERDGARAKVAAQADEIERLSAGARDAAWEGATAARTLDGSRLVAILRASGPLRLAFVDALHDRALQTLRRAAQDPGYADALAADLLALDVPEVG